MVSLIFFQPVVEVRADWASACTSVVTEIRYHEESMIVAEVQFLTRAEWKEELEILLNDLVDENGKCKSLSDLSDVSEVAWYKASNSSWLHSFRKLGYVADLIFRFMPSIRF